MPVSVTTATALPAVTRQPENTMVTRSPSGTSPESFARASFSAGTLSPVREDSSTAKLSELSRRASAGTRSPVFRRMMSPGTSCAGSSSCTFPSRKTRQTGDESVLSASSAFSALRSCVTASAVFMTMTANTTTGSIKPSPSTMASVRLSTAAIRSMITETSLNCARIRRISFCLRGFSKTFAPKRTNRASASAALRPVSL